MLAGRKGAAALAVDEDFDAFFSVRGAEPHVVGGAFVAEGRRHGPMDLEMLAARKGEAELRIGVRPFMASVGHRPQIGDGEVAEPVVGVGRGRDGRGIGRPHGGG
jgi:hypothetical protein